MTKFSNILYSVIPPNASKQPVTNDTTWAEHEIIKAVRVWITMRLKETDCGIWLDGAQLLEDLLK